MWADLSNDLVTKLVTKTKERLSHDSLTAVIVDVA